MTGTPFLWSIARKIEDRGGEEWFFGQVVEDVPVKHLAALLGCDRKTLYAWIDMSPARKEMLVEARRLQARSIVEDMHTDMKGQVLTPVEAQALSNRARFNQWRAERFGREEFGTEKGQVNVQVNLGSAHTDMLRARVVSSRPHQIAGPVVEAEVVEVDG